MSIFASEPRADRLRHVMIRPMFSLHRLKSINEDPA